MERLSVTFGKKLVWKFSAGVVDDAGGNVNAASENYEQRKR